MISETTRFAITFLSITALFYWGYNIVLGGIESKRKEAGK